MTREIQEKMLDLIISMGLMVENGWTEFKDWDMVYKMADTQDIRKRIRELQNKINGATNLKASNRLQEVERKLKRLQGGVSRITRKLQVGSFEERQL